MRTKTKRIIQFLILAVFVVGLMAGCGGNANNAKDAADSDKAYILDKGAMKVGMTVYAPMNYFDDQGNLTGFDTEFTIAVCDKLGIEPDFIEINWDTKEVELAAKNIDCIWNGLTVTEERKKNIQFSDSYIRNKQVVVIRLADIDKFNSKESLAGARLTAEIASAGESAIQDDDILAGANYTAMAKQTDTLMEVKAGTADAAVLDYTAAKTLVGAGTSYNDLMIIPGVDLASEEYAIGFRIGSDIVPEINKIIQELIADGTLDKIAAKYDLSYLLLSNQ